MVRQSRSQLIEGLVTVHPQSGTEPMNTCCSAPTYMVQSRNGTYYNLKVIKMVTPHPHPHPTRHAQRSIFQVILVSVPLTMLIMKGTAPPLCVAIESRSLSYSISVLPVSYSTKSFYVIFLSFYFAETGCVSICSPIWPQACN